MNEEKSFVDTVRASRDGHQYHEAWTARIAFELLHPDTSLTALAIEGFSHEEAPELSEAAHEIADLVRYRGGKTVATAAQVETLQFKYSVAAAHKPMRASEMVKTLQKFVAADSDIRTLRPNEIEIGRYELVTNRPIDGDTLAGLHALGTEIAVEGRIADHAAQLRAAIGLEEEALRSFAKRLTLTGTRRSLDRVEHSNLQTLASWAGATDNLSRVRLSNLRKLVRDRAGSRGQSDNLLGRIDILGALDIAHERDLYPVRAAFPAVVAAIERPILSDMIAALFADSRALLVHAAGGIGKTVLIQALANRLADQHCVLLFDGFGAGIWREPSDCRHLPRKSLPHLANMLAADGLCDLMFESNHDEDAIATFRERLLASVEALHTFRPDAEIILALDAIDHCGMQAERTGTRSFAHLILQSLNVAPIDGVRAIGSCRSHRKQYAQDDARCREFEIPAFTREETARLVRSRCPSATATDVTALQLRSNGNPRLLDNLLRRGPPFDAARPNQEPETLEALLREQINAAEENAIARGATAVEARGLLAGLAMLPPPVPPEELAAALGLSRSDVESFVADLFPLIEATPTGLIFRDEPIETLVVERIADDAPARNDLIVRLQARQNQSIYAARALPEILMEAGSIDTLVALAFEALKTSGFSRVARRAIRLARLNAATSSCARAQRSDDLVGLALEAAQTSSATERSDAYLRAHPDLVALSGDPEAKRRFRDDRSGWPGARHASLAALDAFSGDLHSAALESDRALTWVNWWIGERREGRTQARHDLGNLEAEAIFVQLLLGKTVRVDRWLATLQDFYAFKIAAAMLRLADRLATLDGAGETARQFWSALEQCRTKSPAVLAAVLERTSLPIKARPRLLSRLAALPVEDPKPTNYDDLRREDRFADALLGAAGQAVELGLFREAQAIPKHGPHRLLRAYELSDPWPLSGGNVTRHIKRAAIAAAARRRPTRVTDILPADMVAAVSLSVRRRGPAAFERRLRQIISGAPKRRGKPSKEQPDREEARRWEQLLSHRLAPVPLLVDQVAAILTSDTPANAINSAVAAALAAIAKAENYPYRDQRSFLRHLCLDVIHWAASCRAPLDQASGDRLAAFLEDSGSRSVSDWLQTVALLARGSATHAAALRLARLAETVIAEDTNVTEQIRCYGALARALLPISANEARPYFRIGLELADAVGSDDQERIGDFITLVAQYEGEPLAPETSHQFVRLCELNFPDEAGALDWRAFGRALTSIAGPAGLALLARLADRNKIDLGWTLPPMLKALVERERFHPALAAGLVGLASFQSTWNWFPPYAAQTILPRLDSQSREPFADMLLIDLDREDATQIHSEILKGYKALFDAELPVGSPARRRIAALQDHRIRRESSESSSPPRISADIPERLRTAATLSPVELRTLIDKAAEAIGGHRPTDGFLLQGFVADLVDPAPRAALLTAVTTDNQLRFADKLLFLEEARDKWCGQSRALDDQLNAAVSAIALRHLDEVVRSGDTWRRPLSRISYLSDNPSALTTEILQALPGLSVDTSSDFWMACATQLAESASSVAVGEAISRYITSVTGSFPETIGDGPWTAEFTPSTEVDAIVADLLWMRLGAPEAADRWRTAHAIRRLARFDETKVLDVLMAGMERRTAGAFQDRSLPFFHLHAHLWLLITVARLAKDIPDQIVRYRAVLEAAAKDDVFPHVLCRHFAIAALRTLAELDRIAERETYLDWLQGLNRPSLQRAQSNTGRPGFYEMRPENRPEPQPPFRFDYDFDKYQVDPLGRVFGLPKWDVEDAGIAWIRAYDANVESMWACPRPRWSSEDRSYGSTSFPAFDLHGGQLAWHAMLLTAGQFARKRSVTGDSWEDSPWENWFSEKLISRDDGLWLADGTDLFPLEDQRALLRRQGGVGETPAVPLHPLDLLPIAGFDDSLQTPDNFLVHANWESAEGLDVTIGSQLVSSAHARTIAHAVYSADPFFAYLPIDDDSDDGFDRRKEREKQLMTRWITADQHNHTKLDERDPYGFSTALRRARPAREIAVRMNLHKADAFGRAWADPDGRTIFEAEAWGTRKGQGRHATERGGTRLSVARDALAPLLQAEDQALLLLIKVRRYLEKEANDDHFRHQMLALIIRHGEPVELVWLVPPKVRAAIGRLGHNEKSEFTDRLAAIETVGQLRCQAWPRNRPRSKTLLEIR